MESARAKVGAKVLAAAAAIFLLVSAACTSSTTSSGASHGPTYTVGILTDVTGPGASADASSVQGVEAGIVAARQEGYNFNYVVGDTQTS
ncbi:MAG TPA: hypothetical protein VEJ87_11055, partial [Acidimicrobiales bacterium]|nr:hypothetical protein [Acidimicrobiales bacterium]